MFVVIRLKDTNSICLSFGRWPPEKYLRYDGRKFHLWKALTFMSILSGRVIHLWDRIFIDTSSTCTFFLFWRCWPLPLFEIFYPRSSNITLSIISSVIRAVGSSLQDASLTLETTNTFIRHGKWKKQRLRSDHSQSQNDWRLLIKLLRKSTWWQMQFLLDSVRPVLNATKLMNTELWNLTFDS